MKKIPFPVIQRLSQTFGILRLCEELGVGRISSAELGEYLGQTAHTVRKDINFCGVAGVAGTKYDVVILKKLICDQLGFGSVKNCCIVGLGMLGSAMLEQLLGTPDGTCRMVAGFDSNVNRLETIRTTVRLFPAYRIEEVVRQMAIELAVLTVPAPQAQEVADRCCDGGIKGILNCTTAVVKPKNSGVFVRSMDVAGELRILAAQAFTNMRTTELTTIQGV